MDALDLLISDHNRTRGLFHRFDEAKEAGDHEQMAQLATELRSELEVHMAIEEEIFYPEVNELTAKVHDVVAESIEEHHEVKVLLGELVDLDVEDDAWLAKWTVVKENIEHHAGEEESELFPKVRSHTDAPQREALGRRLDDRKGELGAATLADRSDLTNDQVRALATEQQIPGRSKMSAEERRATVSPG